MSLNQHGVVVDLLDLFDQSDEGANRRRVVGLDAVDGEDDVVGAERAAVVKLHALPQLERPLGQIGRERPAFGKPRVHLAVALQFRQSVEHVEAVVEAERRCILAWIERRKIARQCDCDRFGAACATPPRTESEAASAAAPTALAMAWKKCHACLLAVRRSRTSDDPTSRDIGPRASRGMLLRGT